ncbi:MAG: hypothetical protein KJ064_11285 [Anaerolineae bacterium]|jgi:hypothetical protein|nr:MAG: hypothetical protein F9K27_00465 [Anaerolineae bacterium]MCL4877236.1 hypothetical protein [Anaerolineae bacterium]
MAEESKKNTEFENFVEHQKKAFEEAGKALEALIPPDFMTHSKAAFKESIEGFRVLVNATLDTISAEIDKTREKTDSTASKKKVDVE